MRKDQIEWKEGGEATTLAVKNEEGSIFKGTWQ